jgi:hypothetical protein
VNGVQVVTPLIALWWPLPGPDEVAAWLSKPLSTWISLRNGASGAALPDCQVLY